MIKVRFAILCLCVVATAITGASANSSSEVLTFRGLQDLQQVGNFYNGGGPAGVPNFGVSFSSNFYALHSVLNGGSGNFLPDPSGTPVIFLNGVTGTNTTGYMNVSQGFATGLAFLYTSSLNETVTVWSGANGTGTVLATLSLLSTNGSCSGTPSYCNWSSASLLFSGTAKSVTFSGGANGIGITDISLGTPVLNAVPEPSSLLLCATGLFSMAAFLRRHVR